jgi:hypothetical protein
MSPINKMAGSRSLVPQDLNFWGKEKLKTRIGLQTFIVMTPVLILFCFLSM